MKAILNPNNRRSELFGFLDQIQFSRALRKASSLEVSERWAEAKVSYERAGVLNSYFPEAWRGAARCALRLDDRKGAQLALTRLLDLVPGDSYALLGMGRIAFAEDRLEEAKRFTRAALMADPRSEEAANALTGLGDALEANTIRHSFSHGVVSELAMFRQSFEDRLDGLLQEIARLRADTSQTLSLGDDVAQHSQILQTTAGQIEQLSVAGSLVIPRIDQIEAALDDTRRAIGALPDVSAIVQRHAEQIEATTSEIERLSVAGSLIAPRVDQIEDDLDDTRRAIDTLPNVYAMVQRQAEKIEATTGEIERLSAAGSLVTPRVDQIEAALGEARRAIEATLDVSAILQRHAEQIEVVTGQIERLSVASSLVPPQIEAAFDETRRAIAALPNISEIVQRHAEQIETSTVQIAQLSVASSLVIPRVDQIEVALDDTRRAIETLPDVSAMVQRHAEQIEATTGQIEQLSVAGSLVTLRIDQIEAALNETRHTIDAMPDVTAIVQRHVEQIEATTGQIERLSIAGSLVAPKIDQIETAINETRRAIEGLPDVSEIVQSHAEQIERLSTSGGLVTPRIDQIEAALDQTRRAIDALPDVSAMVQRHAEQIEWLSVSGSLVTPRIDQIEAALGEARRAIEALPDVAAIVQRHSEQIEVVTGQIERLSVASSLVPPQIEAAFDEARRAIQALPDVSEIVQRHTEQIETFTGHIAQLSVASSLVIPRVDQIEVALDETRRAVETLPDVSAMVQRHAEQIEATTGHIARVLDRLSSIRSIATSVADMARARDRDGIRIDTAERQLEIVGVALTRLQAVLTQTRQEVGVTPHLGKQLEGREPKADISAGVDDAE